MDALMHLAREHNLRTVEICAHALGAEYNGRKVGALADIGVLSLGSKNISIAATGGAVVTQSEDLYEESCKLYRHGWARERITPEFFQHVAFSDSPMAGMFPVARNSTRPGLNLQLDEIPCAIGRIVLRKLDKWTERRREVAALYDRLIRTAGIPIITPAAKQHVLHAYLHYVIRSKERDQLFRHLNENGVEALIHYPVPIPDMEYYATHFPTDASHYPVARRLAGEILSLPNHPWITDEEVGLVVQRMQAFYASG
jgi:dTDP-4-amino-4,6-dideoxygalactose transaminase